MAYRSADYERWQQLPFVVGIEIKLSNNHNCVGIPKGRFVDICDDLDGVYPKDFKFTGWHPQCRCVSIPKLASVDEMLEYQEKVLNDEDVSNYHFKGEVRNMPKNFSDWWVDNQKRIMSSSSLPYWVRDNKDFIETPTAFIPKTDEATKKDFIYWARSKGISIQERDVVVDNGFIHLQSDQHQKIYEALKPETDDERTQLWKRSLESQRKGRAGYIRTSNSFNINKDFRQTSVTGVIDKTVEAKLRANGMTDDDIKTCKLLDKKTSEFSLPVPIRVTRYVEPEALSSIFGETIDTDIDSRFSAIKTLKSIDKSEQIIRSDPAYLSASTNEDQNMFAHFDIKLEIEVPPNTPFYLTNNYAESEVVFGRSTKLQFISAKNEGGYVVVRARITHKNR